MFWFIILFLVIMIMVIFEARYYIAFFCHMIINKHKYTKEKNKLLKANIKKRLLKNEEVKYYTNLVTTELEKIGYENCKIEYKIDPNLERELRFSKLDDKPVKKLLESIMSYMKLDKNIITFKIYRASSRTRGRIVGLYNENMRSIKIEINTYTTIDNLVSIIAHECSHHLLLSNGIKIEPRSANEILTDMTAIYLGFGEYFYRGYKMQRRLVFDGEYRTLIDGDKLGYIAYGDVKYALSNFKTRKKKRENERLNDYRREKGKNI